MPETTDLTALTSRLVEDAASASSGRATHLVHAAPDGRLSHVILALREGASLSEHENPGEATVQALLGHLTLSAGEESWELRAGHLVPIPQRRHALLAHEDSVVVLTIARG